MRRRRELVSGAVHVLAGVVFGLSVGLVLLANQPLAMSFTCPGHPRLFGITDTVRPGNTGLEEAQSTPVNTNQSYSDRRNVRIVCWVFIQQPQSFSVTSRHVTSTWARKCDKLIFFVLRYNASVAAVGLDKEMADSHIDYSSSLVILGFRYVFQNHVDDGDWFLGMIGNRYIIMENLRHFLSALDMNHPAYYGHKLRSSVSRIAFASPRSGIVLSKVALGRLGSEGNKSNYCNDFPIGDGEQFATCMEQLGVTLEETVDDLGKSRFLLAALSEQFETKQEMSVCRGGAWKDLEPLSCKKPSQAVSDELISFSEVMPWYYSGYEYFIYSLKHTQP